MFTEWGEDSIAVSGDGLSILKKEVESDELHKLGFKRDGNTVIIPKGKAHELESICKRIIVPVHWAESAKTA